MPPPIARNITLKTYPNIAIHARLDGVDPEGDLLTFQLVEKPARGSVEFSKDDPAKFVYTPYENKTGKDTFSYIVSDSAGNLSEPAVVEILIEKAKTKVTYSDMSGNAAHHAAIRLIEENIWMGERIADNYFFRPEETVSRSEFLVAAMKVSGIDSLSSISQTGFSDDEAISTWARPYVATALKSGAVRGLRSESGELIFAPNSSITYAEASVLLNRLLALSDVSESPASLSLSETSSWAVQSAANLTTCGVLSADSFLLSETVSRAAAAQMLSGALDIVAQRENANHWFG